MLTYLNIWNTQIPIKTKDCSLNSNPAVDIEPRVNLYVRMTAQCNASCPFCEFSCASRDSFDTKKFISMFTELSKHITVGKVSFTGGEPTLRVDILNGLAWAIKAADPQIFTVISTNGYAVDKLNLEAINSVALSRHHYNSQMNDWLFNNALIPDVIDLIPKDKLHLTCNLIKGGVDSPEEIYKYISHYSKRGVDDFGFVNLMQVNDWTRTHNISKGFEAINLLSSVPNTKKVHTLEKYRGSDVECRCNNYETEIDGRVVFSYARANLNSSACESILVYDVNQLKLGFNGPVIL